MNKRFQILMAVVVAVMALTALSAGVVMAQQDGKAAWNPSVPQAAEAPYCGNASCTGDCNGNCDGNCNGNCTTNGVCGNGFCGQANGQCAGGNCAQIASSSRFAGQAG
ncbi:MAG TPA: hypothetical protein DCX22_01240, partial [Dehalococcoidia bacterium]|nr:hypothetical protein [Dehalococcoidia bacterium]